MFTHFFGRTKRKHLISIYYLVMKLLSCLEVTSSMKLLELLFTILYFPFYVRSAVLLDVVAVSALIIYGSRVALGYKQTWDRYQVTWYFLVLLHKNNIVTISILWKWNYLNCQKYYVAAISEQNTLWKDISKWLWLSALSFRCFWTATSEKLSLLCFPCIYIFSLHL